MACRGLDGGIVDCSSCRVGLKRWLEIKMMDFCELGIRNCHQQSSLHESVNKHLD